MDQPGNTEETLSRAGLTLLKESSFPTVSPMTAWKLVIGAGVKPDSVVLDDSPGHLDKVDEEWLEIATRAQVLVAGVPFWIHVAGPGARRQGWRKVMITGPVQLAENLGTYAGEPEFVAMDLGERVVCGVTSEEDETWIVSARLDGSPLTDRK
ncbi:hypothetical protein GCM10010172_24210 [Paractinoplanes ferrugineus]|uniref:Uncharacterized protein n=2 Tax=Paractinoplanes ferrugineus TaxID=113564 RepID=A0A919IWM7_9ACTN|nr:hypothetical protein Afe05nite_05080 [Actinoplanes ferrugineus]